MRLILTTTLICLALLLPLQASAFDLEQALRDIKPQTAENAQPGFGVTKQGGGKSLSEAIESVRNDYPGGRILSAETKVSNGREVHHIKVLTKDGKVKTVRVNGHSR